jgi:oligoribonuclease NrnB/cAMP/cGMP phosphodiesterase (DHH superfamily)
MKPIVILYHADCPDGFGAAWAAWKKLGNGAEYRAISHGMPPLPGLRGKEIYLLDIIYSPRDLARLRKINKRVMVIDHHESARDIVTSQPEHIYSATHSGAYLAWRYFHPRKKVPLLLLYVQDCDFWRFTRPHACEIVSAIDLEKFDFKAWTRLAEELDDAARRRTVIARGKIALATESRLMDRIVQFNAEPVRFLGRKIYVVNSPIFESEIPHKLIERYPPMSVVWRVRNGMKSFSIRTDGSVDASAIAKRFGGGGHPRSAGFALPLDAPFPWTWLKKRTPKKGA